MSDQPDPINIDINANSDSVSAGTQIAIDMMAKLQEQFDNTNIAIETLDKTVTGMASDWDVLATQADNTIATFDKMDAAFSEIGVDAGNAFAAIKAQIDADNQSAQDLLATFDQIKSVNLTQQQLDSSGQFNFAEPGGGGGENTDSSGGDE